MTFRAEHPLRRELHDELHARPSIYFDGDTDVWHVAIVGHGGAPSIPNQLCDLAEVLTTQSGKHGLAPYANGRLKWERHTEFLTLTLAVSRDSAASDPPYAFQELCDLVAGQVIAAIRVVVREEQYGPQLSRPGADFVASKVGGGHAEVFSNFRLSKSGFVEIYLFNRCLNAYRAGRMVRRLLEIETYRMMASLALPVAQNTIEMLSDFDRRVNSLVAHMQSAAKIDKALLSEVTKLSSDVLSFSASARRSFSATKAYADIVSSRIEELREERIEQRQRISTFIDRRFQPAIRACAAVERRLDDLAERVSLTGDLLRTTVQVQLEDQNASLLASMDERTRIQIHIQQAVEGFSVIAITYYAIGLLKNLLDSASELGLDTHLSKLMVLALIPIVLGAAWKVIHSVRKSFSGRAP